MNCTRSTTAANAGFAPARVERVARPDGSFVLRSPVPLAACIRCVGDWLVQWAQRTPQQTWLAERGTGGWRTIAYAQGLEKARAVGGALVRRGIGIRRPLVILSDNSVDHALLAAGAQLVGVPYAPISPAYSLLSSDHAKLRAIFSLLEPGLVYADDGVRFARALNALGSGFEFVASRNVPPGASRFDDLLAHPPGPEIDAAAAAVTPDTIAKILFTSGSTGDPKGVITTHRMLTANQQMIRHCWPFLEKEPP